MDLAGLVIVLAAFAGEVGVRVTVAAGRVGDACKVGAGVGVGATVSVGRGDAVLVAARAAAGMNGVSVANGAAGEFAAQPKSKSGSSTARIVKLRLYDRIPNGCWPIG